MDTIGIFSQILNPVIKNMQFYYLLVVYLTTRSEYQLNILDQNVCIAVRDLLR